MVSEAIMTDLLTICILTLNEREQFYKRLTESLHPQLGSQPVRIVTVKDNRENTIGAKRNKAVDMVTTPYLCFIDDDDLVGTDYIDQIVRRLKTNPDAVGLKGIVTQDNHKPQWFVNSAGLQWEDKPRKIQGRDTWHRPVNHLNPIRTEIARKFPFLEISHAEDRDYSERIAASGLVKVCPLIDKILYFYQYRSKK